MVLEVVQITIKPGSAAEFEAGFARTLPLYKAAKGWRATRLNRSVETENRYVLFVEWDTVEDHTVTFRQSPAFQEFRAIVGPYFDGAPIVEHVEEIVSAP